MKVMAGISDTCDLCGLVLENTDQGLTDTLVIAKWLRERHYTDGSTETWENKYKRISVVDIYVCGHCIERTREELRRKVKNAILWASPVAVSVAAISVLVLLIWQQLWAIIGLLISPLLVVFWAYVTYGFGPRAVNKAVARKMREEYPEATHAFSLSEWESMAGKTQE